MFALLNLSQIIKGFENEFLLRTFESRLISIVIIGFILIFYIIKYYVKLYLRRYGSSREEDIKCYFGKLSRPIRAIMVIALIWIMIVVLEDKLIHERIMGPIYFTVLAKTLQTLVWISAGWFLIIAAKIIRKREVEKRIADTNLSDDCSHIHSIYKISEVCIYAVVIFAIMNNYGIPIKGIITAGGIGGAVLAFANQNLISNIFSGFAIYFDRPFSIGDWVYTSDHKIEGTVTKIGIRITTIMGFDKRPIYVPNSTFNQVSVINASRMTNRRILQYIGLRYQDVSVFKKVLAEIKAMLASHESIDQRQTTLVNVVNGSTNMGSSIEGFFGSSSLNFMVYTFTKTTSWVRFQEVQDDVMLKIADIVAANGAEFAFPSMSLYYDPSDAEFKVRNIQVDNLKTNPLKENPKHS